MFYQPKIFVLYLCVFLASCGGGGGNNNSSSNNNPQDNGNTLTIATGRIVDGPVAGLSYVSGETQGVTSANGEFSYEAVNGLPSEVIFSLGNIIVGSATGKATITPLDFVETASSANMEVINIVRFLTMLDEDSENTNGIQISSSIFNNLDAFNWQPIDFSSADFDTQTQVTDFISDISSLNERSYTLPSNVQAQLHLESSLNCLASGIYFGFFSGDDNGPIALGIDPLTGFVGGIAWSRLNSIAIGIPFNTTPIDYGGTYGFSVTSQSSTEFSGTLDAFEHIEGSWSNAALNTSGSYSIERVSGNSQAIYRFTGQYTATLPNIGEIPVGVYAIDIDAQNNATGTLVDIILATSEEIALSGSVQDGVLTMEGTDGTMLTGFVDLSNLSIQGTWSNTGKIVQAGNLGLNGCRLNP